MGVFDILPGLGGDDEAGTAESADDSGDAGGSAGDQASLAGLDPGDFRERAAALTERSDVPTLDFTVESLESLDGLAAGPPSAVDDRVAYGSYLGETIVREFGGEWTDEGDWQVAVELSDDQTTIAVFDAAEMSIAEEPVFAKVVEHLEAQGAERTPTAPDDPVTDAGVETGEADDGPSGGSGDQQGTGAGGDTEPSGRGEADDAATSGRGEADDAATFGIGEDDAEDLTEPDTVVVDEPVADTVGQPADASSAGDGQSEDAASVGDGATATADATAPDDEADSSDDEVDTDVGADSDELSVATGTDGTDDDAPSTSAPFVPDSADSSGPAGDDDRSEPGRSDDETTTDVDRDDAHGESGRDETDSEDEAGGGSGLLSSSVLPFGGGGDDADDASDATGDADDGVTEDESTSGTDGEAPTADRDDEDPVSTHADGSDASATASSAAVTDASDGATDPSDDATDASDDATDASGDEGGDGDADASVDDAPVDDGSENDDFVPDSSGGYSTTDFSSGDYSLGTDEDDESTAGADSDDATADADDTGVAAADATTDAEPTKSISEQIEDIRNDVGPSTDGDADGSADGDGETAGAGDADDGSTTRASPLESGPAVDETAAGVGDGDAVDDGADTADDSADTADDGADATGGRPAAPERYVLRKAAEDLADGWPERDLDFTPASLPRLDTFVDQQWDGRFRASSLENRTVHHEERGAPLVQLGAYYAEVLIRALDGEWVATDDGEGAIEVPDVGERTERVDVFAVARECLVPPSTFAYRYDALVNGLHADEPAVSDGRAHVFDDDRATLTSGDVITQFAATAEDAVEEWEKYPLDYSPRSVRALDEIVDWLTEGVDLADVPLSEGTDPESLWLTARATSLGAYYAAVLLRHRDAQWQIDGDDVELVIDRPDGERTVDPVATAADTLRGDGSFVDTYAALDD